MNVMYALRGIDPEPNITKGRFSRAENSEVVPERSIRSDVPDIVVPSSGSRVKSRREAAPAWRNCWAPLRTPDLKQASNQAHADDEQRCRHDALNGQHGDRAEVPSAKYCPKQCSRNCGAEQ